jgi:hypothetical protein
MERGGVVNKVPRDAVTSSCCYLSPVKSRASCSSAERGIPRSLIRRLRRRHAVSTHFSETIPGQGSNTRFHALWCLAARRR